MKISEIMTKPVVTIGLDDAVYEIKEIFSHRKIRHIIVVEEAELFGVVSERDLLRALSPSLESHVYNTRDMAKLNQRIHEIVTRQPISLPINACIFDVIDTFKTKRVGCIPIVDENNTPVGIITRSDIFRHFDQISAAYTIRNNN